VADELVVELAEATAVMATEDEHEGALTDRPDAHALPAASTNPRVARHLRSASPHVPRPSDGVTPRDV
jgi:hypothetical protein